jgi:hypothetical protein
MKFILLIATLLFSVPGNAQATSTNKNKKETVKMNSYIISEECRHYLDAILPTFKFDRIADIRGSVEKVIVAENVNKSQKDIYLLSLKIQGFLEKNKFGHSVDYVFIIDKKGIDLKDAGSLSNYEKKSN